MVAIDDDVVVHEGINNRVVSINRAVRDAVHDNECATKSVAGQSRQIIISNRLVFIDNSDAAGIGYSVAQEVIVLDKRVMTVPHGQSALALKKHIALIYVAARLAGDNFELATGPVEVVITNNRVGVFPGIVACPDSQCLATI